MWWISAIRMACVVGIRTTLERRLTTLSRAVFGSCGGEPTARRPRSGARSGELLALTWDDVDIDARTIVVRRSLSWARTRDERESVEGGRFFEPKTEDSGRSLSIDDELARELRKWKLACPPSKLALVFPTLAGTPLHRRSLHKHGLLPTLKAAELPHFTIHSLRHFHASALLLAGVPVAEVSSRLGHKNAAITMHIYTHFLRGAESRAAETIAAVIRAVRGGENVA
jgi:integrase